MTKKYLFRIWIIISIICVIFFSDWCFAAEVEGTSIFPITWLTSLIVNVLSWGRVLLAKLAWEFLTNQWVYGKLLWLDALFWKYRNVTKNIANFCLGFYFVFIIFKWLIDKWKSSIENIIKDKILWILLAWVWIQASWFFTSAMIDVSTITLVAAWSLPAQVIAENEKVHWSYQNSLSEYFDEWSQQIMYWKYIDLFSTDSPSGKYIQDTKFPLQTWLSKEQFFDLLLPSEDTVSGPLYYMWFAILNANKVPSIDQSNSEALKWSMLRLIIDWWTTVVYAIEMFVLCVLALIRIIYLWMFIVLSPLAIFLWCLKMSKEDKVMEWSFVKTMMEQINMKSFFINIFKPTIIVLWLGLATIFVALMKWVLIENGNKPVDLWWLVITTDEMPTTNDSDEQLYESTMDWGVLKFTIKYVWKWFLDFIMSIFTVVLVYLIINFAVKIWDWKDFVSNKLAWVQKSVEWVVTSLPVMPVAWYDKDGMPTTRYMNIGSAFWIGGNTWMLGKKIAQYQWWIDDIYGKQNEIIKSWFWNKTGYLTTSEKQAITRARTSTTGSSLEQLAAMKNQIPKVENWKWMKLNWLSDDSKFWIGEFGAWLEGATHLINDSSKNMYWKDMKEKYESLWDEKTMKGLFEGQENLIRTYVNYFNLDKRINNWEQLKEADISKK